MSGRRRSVAAARNQAIAAVMAVGAKTVPSGTRSGVKNGEETAVSAMSGAKSSIPAKAGCDGLNQRDFSREASHTSTSTGAPSNAVLTKKLL
jgi:hypothetical protein